VKSEWFHDFLTGLEFRMGCQSDPNHRLLIGAVVHMLALLRADAEEAEEAGSMLEANELWRVGTYVCMLTADSLQGNSSFYMELTGLAPGKGRGETIHATLNKTTLLEEVCRNQPHMTVCLLGKFKGEMGTDHHLLAIPNKMVSGLEL
jgi:hypothetical protein